MEPTLSNAAKAAAYLMYFSDYTFVRHRSLAFYAMLYDKLAAHNWWTYRHHVVCIDGLRIFPLLEYFGPSVDNMTGAARLIQSCIDKERE